MRRPHQARGHVEVLPDLSRRPVVRRHEVDQPFDGADERGLQIAEARHGTQHPARAVGRLAPTQRGAHPGLPVGPARHHRPRSNPDRRRCDRLPDVDERVAGDEHVRSRYGVRGARLLAADQVVDEDAQPPVRTGAERRDGGGQVVHAVHRLDDHALHPQVVAPHGLDQRSVVDALHPVRLARAVRAVRFTTATEPDADRAGPLRVTGGGTKVAGFPSTRKRGRAQREHPVPAVAVLHGHLAGVGTDHRSAEPGRRVLDHRPARGGYLGDRRGARMRVPSAAKEPRQSWGSGFAAGPVLVGRHPGSTGCDDRNRHLGSRHAGAEP